MTEVVCDITKKVTRTWMYTLCNWTDLELAQLETLPASKHVCGSELCPTTGTPHLQGRVTLKTPWRLSKWKKFNKRLSMRPAIFIESDYEYKDGDVLIDLDNREQGCRTDMENLKSIIKEGACNAQICEEYPGLFLRYHGGIDKMRTAYEEGTEKSEYTLANCISYLGIAQLEFKKTEIVIGPSGTGKTEFCLAHFENPLFVTHMDGLKRFRKGFHDGIVFDDMSFLHMPREAQIQITDMRQSRDIHVRYGTVTIPKGTKKVIACNVYPLIDDTAVNSRVNVTEVCER